MHHVKKYLRKIVVALIGVPLVILGIILIPLPGPGLLVSFVGLFVLSQEFDWAKPHTERVKKELSKVIQKSKASRDKLNKKQ
ncbi:MAG: hypothetical protein JWO35_356 [Candidatus Saccharibacteria bacterium]|nr:hypothetical protein [Candidatus Saccharibacteria bacterium]